MAMRTVAAHRHTRPVSQKRATKATAVAVAAAAALTFSAGQAWAVPEQGGTSPGDSGPEQGGASSGDSPEQGGTAPAPAPAPAPETQAPTYTPGPGVVPNPPQEAPYQPFQPQNQYPNNYSPVPQGTITAPKPTPPVRPIAPPPDKLRVGNYVGPIPKWMTIQQANSINAWSAYGEAEIARRLISIGVPPDQATRQAAATIIGVMGGGTIGAAALGIPSAIVGGTIGGVVGAIGGGIGGYILGGMFTPPFTPGAPTPGALGGLAIGVAAGAAGGALAGATLLGVPMAALGFALGGTIGGGLAYLLGTGDPGKNPRQPWLPPEQSPSTPAPQAPGQSTTPTTGDNQFEVHLPAQQAQKAGLPAVDYTVTGRGDVNVSANIGGRTVSASWTAEQADAPYQALGAAAQPVKQEVQQLTARATDALQKAVPGLQVAWAAPRPAPTPAPAR